MPPVPLVPTGQGLTPLDQLQQFVMQRHGPAVPVPTTLIAKPSTFLPPPPPPLLRLRKRCEFGEPMPLTDAERASSIGIAAGFSPASDPLRSGYLTAVGNSRLVILVQYDVSAPIDLWSNCVFAWKTMPWWHREFLETLEWVPVDPLSLLEQLANAAR